ncbi:mannose-1-phosphate guanylyltransferase/mannose-6-phosphate isomerase (plasmid) [Rhizobium rosettiformans]|uniref:mannose-1-phosphate guanylyltransferase n=1 Tax=Rhizobium rosettiformans TaxID=1368430 RepID=A0ABX7F210_9HYPH|nr:mannose-1-phosphate guanylyltransferase/mannose-6-phosphate isomerase [Rhizobium rosettiformans]QRF54326.1 mannose-1-phosphate guanylyltransferase/mannose-6-phosphate isomerase [Rhizobium rosettiformans]
MKFITPVLLVGGAGTRLWPLSRKSFPKQFAPLIGEDSLFQASAKRLYAEGFTQPVIITASEYRFIVTEQLAAVGIEPGAILIEPESRNTAPAVLAAALHIAKSDPDGLMLVAPADHVVPDPAAFRTAVAAGIEAAHADQIVTFGIRPTHAETGYGWQELSRPAVEGEPVALKRFVEKPNRDKAEVMYSSGSYLWNAGIFLFKASTILNVFRNLEPDLVAMVTEAVDQAKSDLGFLRLDPSAFSRVPSISIDYAVMERATNLITVPFAAGWSDLGGWDMVANEMGRDARGNSLGGEATAIDCDGSLLRSDTDGLHLVGLGLKDVIAVAMNDAVLIAHRSRAQDVKLAVEALAKQGARQADTFLRDHRPWGWFETLALSDRFQVKRIVVHPGAALSLQSHVHRSEHWIVVSGTARVTVDSEVKLVTENQSVYIPVGAIHRMENPGKVPMVLIEVQTGAYLGEDDIIRYEDIYSRGQGAKG